MEIYGALRQMQVGFAESLHDTWNGWFDAVFPKKAKRKELNYVKSNYAVAGSYPWFAY